MAPTPILYIDLAPAPGGSLISLTLLLQALDKSRWQPAVVLARQNPYHAIEEMGIPVERVGITRRETPATGLAGAASQRKTRDIFRKTPVLSHIWRLGSQMRYWRREILPIVNALTPIIRRHQPALVHLNNSLALMRHGVVAAWRAGAPVLIHSRSFEPTTRFDRRFLAPRVRGAIFISQAVARFQLPSYPPGFQHRVIPNAVSLDTFQRPVDGNALRKELGIPADAPLLGMIGRIIPWKGQHIFIEALARLRQTHPRAKAVIVGQTDSWQGERYLRELHHLTRELDVADSVFWLGHRHDIPRILTALDMLAHCSVTPEPFGRVIIEGMAAGVPVIASAGGGAAEIVEDGVNGLLTPPGDVAALTAAMRKILEDDALRDRLREAGPKIVRERYSITAHVAAVTSFYETLLNSGA